VPNCASAEIPNKCRILRGAVIYPKLGGAALFRGMCSHVFLFYLLSGSCIFSISGVVIYHSGDIRKQIVKNLFLHRATHVRFWMFNT